MAVAGFFAPWLIYLVLIGLHVVLPARRFEGYVPEVGSSRPMRYRLNGLWVLLAALGSAAVVARQGWLPWDWLWQHRWASLLGAATAGLGFTFAVVLGAPPTGRSFLADLYFGRRDNPRTLRGPIDLKMVLYLLGATMLALNLLSFAGHHVAVSQGAPSAGVLLYAVLLGWFVLEYLWFEHVHVYTYDIFAEKVGFKLGWGCLAFYPYFYVIGLWSVADRQLASPPRWLLVLSALVFFAGWVLARGANMQKYHFKRDPRRRFLWLTNEVVSDERHRLLCSGFWGVSRHVNYLGEILMATGLALSLGVPGEIGPWLYPLYYLVLLLPRERDDHRRCAAKYGALWEEYCRRVRWRIVPGVY